MKFSRTRAQLSRVSEAFRVVVFKPARRCFAAAERNTSDRQRAPALHSHIHVDFFTEKICVCAWVIKIKVYSVFEILTER